MSSLHRYFKKCYWYELHLLGNERIAELEAELAAVRACYTACQGFYAEKRAEVERLKADLRAGYAEAFRSSQWGESGGRESGRLQDSAGLPSAAADPAARLDTPRTAVRKESAGRKDGRRPRRNLKGLGTYNEDGTVSREDF